ncbi:unnamed protein product [Amoebophrya sp. A25]|nr:unnamed protein product [Amoebophrya sp. A25]|eukprot:GSA25T00025583001.1
MNETGSGRHIHIHHALPNMYPHAHAHSIYVKPFASLLLFYMMHEAMNPEHIIPCALLHKDQHV